MKKYHFNVTLPAEYLTSRAMENVLRSAIRNAFPEFKLDDIDVDFVEEYDVNEEWIAKDVSDNDR